MAFSAEEQKTWDELKAEWSRLHDQIRQTEHNLDVMCVLDDLNNRVTKLEKSKAKPGKVKPKRKRR
jgi:hypothetical protein